MFSVICLALCQFVLWGWGHRTDMVLIVLSKPCIANFFNDNDNINNNNNDS